MEKKFKKIRSHNPVLWVYVPNSNKSVHTVANQWGCSEKTEFIKWISSPRFR